MKRKGDIADFFVKRHKSGPDQAQADPTPKTSSPGSSQPGASQASQCEHREGSSLPPPDINNDWPDLWSAKQTEDFKSKNPWLGSKNKKLGCLVCSSVNSIGIDKEQGQGVSLSREWMNFEIQVSGQGSRTTSLSILRNKVRKHALSKAHTQAVKVAEQQKEAAIENAVETMTESYMKETEAVFRTAYHLAKKNRPFSDHESLIELQELNGELQSRSITLLRAEHLLKRSIRVIQSFKESPDETIMDLSILDQSKWPSKPSIRHGEEQVKRLCKRFNLCTDQALNGMRDLLEEPSSEPKDLKPLMNCMKTFPVVVWQNGPERERVVLEEPRKNDVPYLAELKLLDVRCTNASLGPLLSDRHSAPEPQFVFSAAATSSLEFAGLSCFACLWECECISHTHWHFFHTRSGVKSGKGEGRQLGIAAEGDRIRISPTISYSA
ncbi:hypothetical protein J4Q44_G00030650 [Coregonus suidteri]|uniref:Uncharacterized protein n=1 Tax=Coregonus suidteri TaxID=861788 RepID=A0AAN8M9S7_9TELE